MRVVPLVALVGCVEGADPTAPIAERPPVGSPTVDGAPAPALELGTGERAFEPLADGDAVIVWRGPQAGYHVNVAGRGVGLPEAVAVTPTLTLSATGEVLTEPTAAWFALALFDET